MNTMEILDPVRPVKSGGYKVDVSRGERNGRARLMRPSSICNQRPSSDSVPWRRQGATTHWKPGTRSGL